MIETITYEVEKWIPGQALTPSRVTGEWWVVAQYLQTLDEAKGITQEHSGPVKIVQVVTTRTTVWFS